MNEDSCKKIIWTLEIEFNAHKVAEVLFSVCTGNGVVTKRYYVIVHSFSAREWKFLNLVVGNSKTALQVCTCAKNIQVSKPRSIITFRPYQRFFNNDQNIYWSFWDFFNSC